VPEDELPELTVEKIQALLQKLERSPNTLPEASAPAARLPVDNDTSQAPVDPGGNTTEMMEPDEHPLLQEELGCMLLDSMGKYRWFLAPCHA
jgi:hypothetical protein